MQNRCLVSSDICGDGGIPAALILEDGSGDWLVVVVADPECFHQSRSLEWMTCASRKGSSDGCRLLSVAMANTKLLSSVFHTWKFECLTLQ